MSGKYRGLEAALRSTRVNAINEIVAGERTGTQVIACEELLPAWTKAGPDGDSTHKVGEPCTHDGQSWRQEHSTKNNPDIEPGKSPAHWAPYHTTDPAKAKPFIQPTGAHDTYMKGEVCLWTDGTVKRSKVNDNAYSPEDYPDNWEDAGEGGAA